MNLLEAARMAREALWTHLPYNVRERNYVIAALDAAIAEAEKEPTARTLTDGIDPLVRKLLDVAVRMRTRETLFRDDEIVSEAAYALARAAIATTTVAIEAAEQEQPVAFANKENLASATEPDSVVPLIAWADGGVLDDRWFDIPLYLHPKEQK